MDIGVSARLSGVLVEPIREMNRGVGALGGSVVAALGLMSLVGGILAVSALGQLKSVKADVAATREQLMLVNEHAASLERRLETALRTIDQQQASVVRPAPSEPGPEKRSDQPTFQLTHDETQLIRSYIKGRPVTSGATATIKVGGELRSAALLPLPSQITGQAPRLAGGRFTMDRNGAIVISLRNSRLADAVIPPK